MRTVSSRSIERIQGRVKKDFYTDKADYIQNSISGYNDYNEPIFNQTVTEIRCSFNTKVKEENWSADGDIGFISAECRFAGFTPSKGDQIRLKSRFYRLYATEDAFTDKVYDIIAIQDRDAFGHVVALREVVL